MMRLSLLIWMSCSFAILIVNARVDARVDARVNAGEVTLDAMRERVALARTRIDEQTRLYHDPVGAQTWIDSSRLWFAHTQVTGEREWWLIDGAKPSETARIPLFDHLAVASLLSEGATTPVTPTRLPVRGVAVHDDRVALDIEGRAAPIVCVLGGAIVDDADESARALFVMPLKQGTQRSRAGGASSAIVFENRLSEPVEIFWIDMEMHARSYGVIAAGASREQHTFGGHAWAVRTVNGRDLGHTIAGDVTQTVVLREVAVNDQSAPTPHANDGDARTEATSAQASDGVPAYDLASDGANLIMRVDGIEVFRTHDGTSDDGYVGRQFITPSRDAFVAMRVKRAAHREVHVVESTPKDQLQPKLRTIDYVKPGDAIDASVPHLFTVMRDAAAEHGVSVREIAVDAQPFANAWSLEMVRFLPGNREIALLYNQRGHQLVQLIALNLATGVTRTIASESSETFVDYTNKIWMHWLDSSGELLWMSERDGWNHVWLIDVATGAVKRQVTQGAWVVKGVEHVDEAARTIDIRLVGRDANQDPYHEHFARVALESGAMVMLTSGNGTCRVEFSPDRSALMCVRARADIPPVHEMRRASDGAVVAELGAGDARAMISAGWRAPQPFVAKGRDGETLIWGLVYRPSNFDPSRKYPVIENIYAGPHDQHVPKWFELRGRSREYAEMGAIVVQIDGMGTNWRSKAFHDVCWKNLKDAGFPDRIAWMRELASRDASLDLDRVGIFGGSAGGQNAMRAVLDHADFYRVAVADCGCHDNRMDKIWWNEQWMGWPVDESYERNSNMVDAAKLGGALMLVVGGLDENVDPATTMQVAQKLIDANKDFELLVIPQSGHGSAESAYGNARRAQFLWQHLIP